MAEEAELAVNVGEHVAMGFFQNDEERRAVVTRSLPLPPLYATARGAEGGRRKQTRRRSSRKERRGSKGLTPIAEGGE